MPSNSSYAGIVNLRFDNLLFSALHDLPICYDGIMKVVIKQCKVKIKVIGKTVSEITISLILSSSNVDERVG